MPSDVTLVLSTFPDQDTARKITRTLVEERLVACGNLIAPVESIYTWKGEIEATLETLVTYKTTTDRTAALLARLRELHPYDVPEMLQIPAESGWPAYLQWVRDSVGPTSAS
jgi:periplasmic divalent cation tolerance protein